VECSLPWSVTPAFDLDELLVRGHALVELALHALRVFGRGIQRYFKY
jgi:hypothetical protein